MMHRVKSAHSRADGVLVAAVSVVVLGVAPLVGFNFFAETFTQVFSSGPSAIKAVERLDERARAHLAAESQCLAEAMYFEARGEGVVGQKAVAEVVLQRTRHRHYGDTVCAVVYEGIEYGLNDCQFSFACDGLREIPHEETVWLETRALAEKIMTGEVKLAGVTGRAISYHSVDVMPYWAESMVKTAQIGNHVFYRPAPRVAVVPASDPPPRNASPDPEDTTSDNGV